MYKRENELNTNPQITIDGNLREFKITIPGTYRIRSKGRLTVNNISCSGSANPTTIECKPVCKFDTANNKNFLTNVYNFGGYFVGDEQVFDADYQVANMQPKILGKIQFTDSNGNVIERQVEEPHLLDENTQFLITKVKIPDGITQIPDNFLSNAPNLTTIEFGISGNLISIGRGAFANSERLEQLILPSGLKEIKSGAFSNCPMLKRILIPRSINRIHQGVFSRVHWDCQVFYKGFKLEQCDNTTSNLLLGQGCTSQTLTSDIEKQQQNNSTEVEDIQQRNTHQYKECQVTARDGAHFVYKFAGSSYFDYRGRVFGTIWMYSPELFNKKRQIQDIIKTVGDIDSDLGKPVQGLYEKMMGLIEDSIVKLYEGILYISVPNSGNRLVPVVPGVPKDLMSVQIRKTFKPSTDALKDYIYSLLKGYTFPFDVSNSDFATGVLECIARSYDAIDTAGTLMNGTYWSNCAAVQRYETSYNLGMNIWRRLGIGSYLQKFTQSLKNAIANVDILYFKDIKQNALDMARREAMTVIIGNLIDATRKIPTSDVDTTWMALGLEYFLTGVDYIIDGVTYVLVSVRDGVNKVDSMINKSEMGELYKDIKAFAEIVQKVWISIQKLMVQIAQLRVYDTPLTVTPLIAEGNLTATIHGPILQKEKHTDERFDDPTGSAPGETIVFVPWTDVYPGLSSDCFLDSDGNLCVLVPLDDQNFEVLTYKTKQEMDDELGNGSRNNNGYEKKVQTLIEDGDGGPIIKSEVVQESRFEASAPVRLIKCIDKAALKLRYEFFNEDYSKLITPLVPDNLSNVEKSLEDKLKEYKDGIDTSLPKDCILYGIQNQ